MTDTQWLLNLVEEATPGPWKAEARFVRARSRLLPHVGLDRAGRRADEDARLIALAPDLARLCVEQHEALERLMDCPNLDAPYHSIVNCRWCSAEPMQQARSVLARFAELKP